MRSAILVGVLTIIVGACEFQGQGIDPEVPDAGDAPDAELLRICEEDNRLVLCLPFEDALPVSIAHDESLYRNDATVTAVAAVPRFARQAFLLSESSTIRVPESAALDAPLAVSLDLWIAPAALPAGDNAWLLDNDQQYGVTYRADGTIRCVIGDRTADSTTVITPGLGWYHVACVYDGALLQVYVAGELETCKVIDEPLSIEGVLGTTIGANVSTSGVFTDRFLGGVDDVRVYNRPLLAPEVCGHAGKGTACNQICPGAAGLPRP